MRAWVRAVVVATAGWGAFLSAPAVWADSPASERSQLARLLGADLGNVFEALPAVLCGNRLISYNSPTSNSPVTCVNGPANSGNSTDSGNYSSRGNPVNSGNFSNTNGSHGSSNSSNADNLANGPQETSIKQAIR
ncbi:hypothetical protein Aph01nite_66990 [Acrocarpospora phusangensis]|uniref:Chaplin domain-containing protein n=1 Tax=Acrocarpospora phusangensis TaxID=1070424 RepID=A0A919QI20_9ACTN|nr:hypothetical protein [Acrocarpospora phusangensis]GIH28389.1 hypothetical protein Aph01nite_66990 [Acrocarpospora phusangensis]